MSHFRHITGKVRETTLVIKWEGPLYAPQSQLASLGNRSTEVLGFRNYLPFVVIQSLSCVQLFATPWTAALQASLSCAVSWSLLKLMSIELVRSSNHLVLCHPLRLLFSIFPSIGAQSLSRVQLFATLWTVAS